MRNGSPLIVHVIHHLVIGGLQNGLVNLINHIDRYRHAIVCIENDSDFRLRINRSDVPIYALNKRRGQDLSVYFKLYRLFQLLQPDIVHSRNLAGLDSLIPAAAAGVRVRIHGEHGRDMGDLDGSSRKYQLLRRLFKPLVHHYVALSKDLEGYLRDKIAVEPERIAQIYNGVDVDRFHPRQGHVPLPPPGFQAPDAFVVGSVGRMNEVKDQLTLVRAFIRLLNKIPGARGRLRLAIIGDGPIRQPAQALIDEAGAHDLAWLPGARDDIPRLLRGFDLFVLPSLAEGISNTILEAMASGLPVVATNVGGNLELVHEGVSGEFIPPRDVAALAQAIVSYSSNKDQCLRQGREARRIAETRFSLEAMVQSYLKLYDGLLRDRSHAVGIAA